MINFFFFPSTGAPYDEDEDEQFFYQVLQVMEHQWNETDRENRSTRGINLSKCHFVHHESHMDLPGIEPGPPR
jgi:hypothetical protein